MNGAILGMSRAEIQSKLDEIIDFSGCERYIDTPVKRYSSGMTVRLGFAVAAFLEPEILVVDEVLAVGDAEFQKKAIGKMKDVSQGQGRTVLFVSHNMASVRNLCKRGILLENGMVKMDGGVNEVVDFYLEGQKSLSDFVRIGNGKIRFSDIKTYRNGINLGDDFIVDLTIEAKADIENAHLSFDIKDEALSQFCHVTDYDDGFQLGNLRKGEKKQVRCVWKNVNFAPGSYVANIWCGDPYNCYDYVEECVRFYVNQGEAFILKETPYDSSAKVVLQSNWQLI
jgi:lipopolysaccharide transport system ATP-binding protein